MAVISSEKTAETIGNLLTKIRRYVGDTDSATDNQRWSDAEIVDVLNYEIYKMHAEMALGNTPPLLTSTTLSYTSGSTEIALPSGPDVNPIFMVEDYTDTSNPIRLTHESILEADRYDLDSSYLGGRGRRWSLIGGNIALRPTTDSTITLRIWYVRAPYGTNTSYGGTDQQPFPVAHEELLTLGAAIRLQETDDEVPPGRMDRYQELWQLFVRSKRKNRGPIYVRKNRRYN